jgi:hypothetical protein
MGYLGNQPAESYASFERQVFTIVNSQTAYTLSHSVTNENDIRLVVNNVVQEPGSGKAYTASGTTLTLSAALVNGTDEMYCVFLGKAVQTVNTPDGSVNTSKLVADAITPPKTNFFNTDPGNAADLGNLHVKTGDSGVTSLSVSHDELVVESDGNAGISIIGGGSNTVGIAFGDSADSDNGRINYVHSDTSLRFINNATENVHIHSNGVMAANAGIALGVGTANTASNVLDDYEEGSWTPAITFGDANSGITYSVQAGRYTKIGNRVIANGELLLTSKGSSTSTARITGLPFTTDNDVYQTAGLYNDRLASPHGGANLYVSKNNTYITLYQQRDDSTNNSVISNSHFNDNTYLLFFLTYRVA